LGLLWDQDVDICVWHDSRKVIDGFISQLENIGYEVVGGEGRIKVRLPNNNRLWLDIYYWENSRSGIYRTKIPKFNSKISKFPSKLLGDYTKLKVFGREFIAPQNYKEKLKKMYGDYNKPVKRQFYWGGKL
jgi:Asp-tRNA(Asn)/Glu-tRNA(Gln) amidotransferase A subunit family amidase